jgi:hypothetical protein
VRPALSTEAATRYGGDAHRLTQNLLLGTKSRY